MKEKEEKLIAALKKKNLSKKKRKEKNEKLKQSRKEMYKLQKKKMKSKPERKQAAKIWKKPIKVQPVVKVQPPKKKGGGKGRGKKGRRKKNKRNMGGWIAGSGVGDVVEAWLTPGEFVVNKATAQEYGPFLEAMNSRKFKMKGKAGSLKAMSDNRSNSSGVYNYSVTVNAGS